MIDYREHNQTAKVEDYGLDVWLGQIQELIKKGYELDFKTNENYPLVFGTMYTCVMVKTNDNTEAVRYMEGYTAGKEWGLAQGATRVVEGGGLVESVEIDPVKAEVKTVEATMVVTEIEPQDVLVTEQPTKVDGRKKK